MNAIIGIAQMQMLDKFLPKEYALSQEKIFNAGTNLLGIINDILDLSKVETGKMEIVSVAYDVPSLISDAIQLNAVRIGSKPIEFQLDVCENLPSRMIGDELRIKQILNNLLSNAIKYTERGFVKMTVNHEIRGEKIILCFAIEDTGQGLKSEDKENLFSEYTRFNTESNRATEGAGIGLIITKNLISLSKSKANSEREAYLPFR
jgi:signal transduction histidine kinase